MDRFDLPESRENFKVRAQHMRLDAEGVQAASVGFPERGFITRFLAPSVCG